jgi:hypothetical protein
VRKAEQNQFIQINGKGPPMEELIVKSNKLVEARYKLSLQEQKIILTMISKIGKNDEDFKIINFNVREFDSQNLLVSDLTAITMS